MPKINQDFRKDMNRVLEVFYTKKGTVSILKAIGELNVPLDIVNLDMICNSLEKDGYVSLIKGHSQYPVGQITGQGRIFFEQGGYRDTTTQLDKMIDWFKNHKVYSVVIFIGIIITSLWGFVSIVKEVLEWMGYYNQADVTEHLELHYYTITKILLWVNW